MSKRYYLKMTLIICVVMLFVVGCSNHVVQNDEVIELKVEISPAYGDNNAAITIISDDGFYQTGYNLNELAKKYNMHITVAGAIKNIEDNLEGWKTIVGDGYIDLVSHSYDHIKMEEGTDISNDEDELYHQIVDADKWYEETFGTTQIGFVCPENVMCEKGYEILKNNGFYAVRKGHRGYNPISPRDGENNFEWFNLGIQGIGDTDDLATRNSWVDYAIASDSWLIEMWHDVDDDDNGHYQRITVNEADEHLAYIDRQAVDNKIWVASYTEAIKYFREKENTYVDAKYMDGHIEVIAMMNEDSYSCDIFNYPLSVRVYLSEDEKVNPKEYVCDGQVLEKKYSDIGECYVVVDIVPNGENLLIDVLDE